MFSLSPSPRPLPLRHPLVGPAYIFASVCITCLLILTLWLHLSSKTVSYFFTSILHYQHQLSFSFSLLPGRFLFLLFILPPSSLLGGCTPPCELCCLFTVPRCATLCHGCGLDGAMPFDPQCHTVPLSPHRAIQLEPTCSC